MFALASIPKLFLPNMKIGDTHRTSFVFILGSTISYIHIQANRVFIYSQIFLLFIASPTNMETGTMTINPTFVTTQESGNEAIFFSELYQFHRHLCGLRILEFYEELQHC